MLRIDKSGSNSLYRGLLAGLLLVTAAATTACEAPTSREDLNPAGPPMVRQVMVTERVLGETGTATISAGQLAFGTHGDRFFENDDGEVLSAFALGNQEIRIVLDELIRGNSLEEIACADGTYSRVPVGTDPDDISDCAGPVDSLLDCDTVCLDPSSGAPIGIRDENEDGAPDDVRMIDYNDDPNITELAVAVTCGGVNIPLDPINSFWSPSGNQTFPSNDTLSYKGLGPAIVLRPVGTIGMRTSSDCSVTFRPEVVDHDGNQICAPTNGDIESDCSGGDTTKIAFSTETLQVVSAVPSDGATDVGLTESSFMSLAMNANLDPATVTALSLTADGAPVTFVGLDADDEFVGDDGTLITYKLEADFIPETTYELTVATTLTDRLGSALPATETISWITEPFALDDSEPGDGDIAELEIIELEFNAPVDPATLGAISMTKDGTPSTDGTPAADGVAVAITPTVSATDPKLVEIDLGATFELDTYYEIVITTAIQDVTGHAITEDQLITFTTTAEFQFANSTPANNDTDVPVAGGDVLLTFNAPVDPATVAAITVTADALNVPVTPVVQADAREVLVSVGAAFDAGADYILTIGTGLQEVDGAAIAADVVINWSTVAP